MLTPAPPPSAALVRANAEARRSTIARSTTATAVGGAALCFAITLLAFSVLPIAFVLGGAGVAMIAAGHEAKTEAEIPPSPPSQDAEIAARFTRTLMERLWLKNSMLALPIHDETYEADGVEFLSRFLEENYQSSWFSDREEPLNRFLVDRQA